MKVYRLCWGLGRPWEGGGRKGYQPLPEAEEHGALNNNYSYHMNCSQSTAASNRYIFMTCNIDSCGLELATPLSIICRVARAQSLSMIVWAL